MYKINEIKELIRTLDQSSIDELTIESEGKKVLTLRRNPGQGLAQMEQGSIPKSSSIEGAAPVPAINTSNQTPKVVESPSKELIVDDANMYEITSPMVGTFYESSSPEDQPYVKVGDQVTNDKVVCIVEAMKLMNELEAEVEGEIVAILVENGQVVEFGQPLFTVKGK